MTTYARYDPNTGLLDLQDMPPSPLDEHCPFWEVPDDTDPNTIYTYDGQLGVKALPPGPELFWEFDPSQNAWVDPRNETERDADFVQYKATAQARITKLRGQARSQYITVIPGQDALYMAKLEEGRDILLRTEGGETPDPLEYPLLGSEIGSTAPTLFEVAQIVVNMNWQWRYVAGQIDRACFDAQAAVEVATIEPEIDYILAALASAFGVPA